MIKVKQLVWDATDGAEFCAIVGDCFAYAIGSYEGSWQTTFNFPQDGWKIIHECDTEAGAKAAAQADFERRVRECLEDGAP